MEFVWILLITTIALYLAYCFFNRHNHPPGPLGVPILGNLMLLNTRHPHKTLQQLSQKYGPIYGLHLGSIYTIVLTDVTIIRECLKRAEYSGRAPLYLTHGLMEGYGIIFAEGILWKDQRRQSIEWLKKLGMSKFGAVRSTLERRIKAAVQEFMLSIESMEPDDRAEEAEEHPLRVNPRQGLQHSMGNIMNDLVFGITYEQSDETWKYLQHLQEEGVKHVGVSGVVNFLPILRFLPSNRRTIGFLFDGKRRTHAIYDKIISDARGVLPTINKSSNAGESESQPRKRNPSSCPSVKAGSKSDAGNDDCILKYFLREKERRIAQEDSSAYDMYSDIQLRHLLADLFGAGVDTSLTTLRWFLLFMAKNPSVQAQLRMAIIETCSDDVGEYERVIGKANVWNPNLSDLEKLDLLKACISETQRIRSVVPLGIPHGTTEETKVCGYTIPKNTMVLPLQWAIHMDAKAWPDPERFDPNRFLTSERKYFLPPSFIPFQTGKRMCPGEDLAKMMLYLFAGAIIANYVLTILPDEDANLDMDGECGITLTPSDHTLLFKKFQKQKKMAFN